MKCPHCNSLEISNIAVPDIDDPAPGKASVEIYCDDCQKCSYSIFQKTTISVHGIGVVAQLHKENSLYCKSSFCPMCKSEELEGEEIDTYTSDERIVQDVVCCECDAVCTEIYLFEKYL